MWMSHADRKGLALELLQGLWKSSENFYLLSHLSTSAVPSQEQLTLVQAGISAII